jgi:hypothetical protein
VSAARATTATGARAAAHQPLLRVSPAPRSRTPRRGRTGEGRVPQALGSLTLQRGHKGEGWRRGALFGDGKTAQ